MTYAVGLDAATVVWVASRFTDEHRAALDWLNRITAAEFDFFGLEIELWQIGNSPLAPNFNVVCQPNDWSRSIRNSATAAQTTAPTDRQKLCLDYWTQFRQFMEERGSVVSLPNPRPQAWTAIATGRANFRIDALIRMRNGRAGVHLVLTGPDAKAHFDLLRERHREQVEAMLGPLELRELPGKQKSQVGVARDATPADPATWPELSTWMAERLESMATVFRRIVKNLDASDYVAAGGFGDPSREAVVNVLAETREWRYRDLLASHLDELLCNPLPAGVGATS